MKRFILPLSLILLPILFILVIAGFFFVPNAVNDYRNKPNSEITDLKWPHGPYKIFYVHKDSLFSQYSDGTEKNLLYKDESSGLNFALIDSTRKILVKTRNKIFLLDEDGTNQKNIFQASQDKRIKMVEASPDGQKIVFTIVRENDYDTPPTIHLADLSTSTSSRLDEVKDYVNYKHIDEIFWYKDSNQIFFYTTRAYSSDDIRSQYINYNANTKKVKYLGEQQAVIEERYRKPLCSFVDVEKLVKKEPSYTYYKSRSLDRKRTAEVTQGNVLINGIEVMHWHGYDSKWYSGYTHPSWLPDNNRLVITSGNIRIIDVDSKKFAKFDEGSKAKWFEQTFDIPDRVDLYWLCP